MIVWAEAISASPTRATSDRTRGSDPGGTFRKATKLPPPSATVSATTSLPKRIWITAPGNEWPAISAVPSASMRTVSKVGASAAAVAGTEAVSAAGAASLAGATAFGSTVNSGAGASADGCVASTDCAASAAGAASLAGATAFGSTVNSGAGASADGCVASTDCAASAAGALSLEAASAGAASSSGVPLCDDHTR